MAQELIEENSHGSSSRRVDGLKGVFMWSATIEEKKELLKTLSMDTEWQGWGTWMDLASTMASELVRCSCTSIVIPLVVSSTTLAF